MLNYATIGARIRQQRKQKKLTQVTVAQTLGISASYYGHIERGTRIPSVETFCKIILALDLSADYVLDIQFPYTDENVKEEAPSN